jgi:hypothetical protein
VQKVAIMTGQVCEREEGATTLLVEVPARRAASGLGAQCVHLQQGSPEEVPSRQDRGIQPLVGVVVVVHLIHNWC